MDETPERLIFNANRAGAALPKGGRSAAIPSDDPVVELVLDTGGAHGAVASKVARQAHCQDSVRQRFLGRNGRGAYIDFDGPVDRRDQGRDREVIRGRGDARNRNDSRDLTYSCAVDPRTGRVHSSDYNYSGSSRRGNVRNGLK